MSPSPNRIGELSLSEKGCMWLEIWREVKFSNLWNTQSHSRTDDESLGFEGRKDIKHVLLLSILGLR